jgi:hypothetical protein
MEKEEFKKKIRSMMPRINELYKKNGPGPDYGKLTVDALKKHTREMK